MLVCGLGSKLSPIIISYLLMSSTVLFSCNTSCVLYSAGFGVEPVYIVMSHTNTSGFAVGNIYRLGAT